VTQPPLPEDLSAVLRHVESTYPSEGCGVILRGRSGAFTIRPMANAYDRYHAVDPEGFPRTSRTAYFFDPKEWLAVSQQAEGAGDQVACIFHSHTDVGAYFSAEDRAMAAPDGEPLHPGVSYLVVAVDAGRATAARLYWWQGGDFREATVVTGI
jgi:[CysO sulfur-carrier protein]-S-L-cysteine hydrolase